MPILTEIAGKVKFGDIIEGVTMEEQVDEVTGLSRKVIIESKDSDKRPRIAIKDGKRRSVSGTIGRYFLPVGANIVGPGDAMVSAGDIIAKIPRETTKTKDITGGLPRVAELFEARKPKDFAVIYRDRRSCYLRQGRQGQAQGHCHARDRVSRRNT